MMAIPWTQYVYNGRVVLGVVESLHIHKTQPLQRFSQRHAPDLPLLQAHHATEVFVGNHVHSGNPEFPAHPSVIGSGIPSSLEMTERHIPRFKPGHLCHLFSNEAPDPSEVVVAEAVLTPPFVHFLHASGLGTFRNKDNAITLSVFLPHLEEFCNTVQHKIVFRNEGDRRPARLSSL